MFKPISKGNGFWKLVPPDKPISYSCIRKGFRRDLKNIGVDPSKFGLHSLRSGGATSAANNEIMTVSFSAMAAGSLLRRKTLMLMIASSKDSQFLSVWVCNGYFFFSFSFLFRAPNTLSRYRVWVGSCQALPK